MSGKTTVSVFGQRSKLNWWTPYITVCSVTGHHGNLLRYGPENRSSPRIVTGKMTTEKLKINYKTRK
jgi:hypothetical protein